MSKMIGLSYLSLLLLGWLDNSRSPFFPDIIQSLQLTAIQGSMLFAITSLLSFLTGFYNDRLLKRISSLQMLQASSAVLGLGFFVISQASSYWLLMVGSTVFGLGYGTLNFSQNVIVQEWAPSAYKRRIFIGLHTMYGLAALLAPLSASAFITIGWPWRKAFLLLSMLPVLLSYASRKFFLHPPKATVHPDTHVTASDLSQSALWLAALSVAFYMFGEIGVSTRLVLLLRTSYNQSAETANTYLAIFFVLLLLGRLFFALMDFRNVSNRKVLIGSALSSALLLSFCLGFHHPYLLAASGMTMAPFYPVGMNYLAESFGASHAARALSFGIALCSLATVILQLSLGVFTDLLGLESAMWLAPAGLCLCVLFLLRPVAISPGAH